MTTLLKDLKLPKDGIILVAGDDESAKKETIKQLTENFLVQHPNANINKFSDSKVGRSPDLILMGELDNLDTIDAMIELSLTGNPVIASIHARTISTILIKLSDFYDTCEQKNEKMTDIIEEMKLIVFNMNNQSVVIECNKHATKTLKDWLL